MSFRGLVRDSLLILKDFFPQKVGHPLYSVHIFIDVSFVLHDLSYCLSCGSCVPSFGRDVDPLTSKVT